jgi:phage gpG-like protein
MALVRADFGRLETLRRQATTLASPGFREELARRLAAAATKQLADQFRSSRDPYGNAWKPVFRNRARDRRGRASARGGRGDKPLIDTGRLRAAALAPPVVSGPMVSVSINVEYASYHQEGTSRIARRQIVPDKAGGLGAIWSAAFERETRAAVNDVMKGGR